MEKPRARKKEWEKRKWDNRELEILRRMRQPRMMATDKRGLIESRRSMKEWDVDRIE